ncbi:MAG: KilA-N domain-containing protein [Bacteroidota bacterium]
MSGISKFEYEGHPIAFEFSNGNRMINATQMAKKFNKLIGNFLRLQGTKDFIVELEAQYAGMGERENFQALRIVQGGTPELQGTWMSELLALKFAAWLNPKFEIWIFDRILELLKTGKTELEQKPTPNLVKSIRLIADQLEEHAGDILKNSNRIEAIEEVVQELESKIISVDDHYYTIAGYCNLKNIPCPLHEAKVWGKAAVQLSKKQNIPTGMAHDERYGRVRTYHQEVLDKVVK